MHEFIAHKTHTVVLSHYFRVNFNVVPVAHVRILTLYVVFYDDEDNDD